MSSVISPSGCLRRAYRAAHLCPPVIFLAVLLFLPACLPAPTPLPPLPTDTPAPPPPPPTATTVWFPPTATYTPLPSPTYSLTPTLDISPKYGALIYSDDFSHPDRWTLGRSSAGSIAPGRDELSLGVSKPGGYLYSLLQEVRLDDFYLEISASPSICRGADEFGLLLRISPSLDFYRFGVNCQGEARLDRWLNGTASAPQPPAVFGAIPPGAPSTSRLAVWAAGKDLRFYVNGEFLFSVRDATLPAGGLGVYIRASGPQAVTVNFSDLQVYEPLR